MAIIIVMPYIHIHTRRKSMFNHEIIIDTIQNGKKQIVETFIADKQFKGELVKLIDAQTEFAKGTAKSSLAIANSLLTYSQNYFSTFTK